VFVAHVENKINDKIRSRFGASINLNNKSNRVIKQRLGGVKWMEAYSLLVDFKIRMKVKWLWVVTVLSFIDQ
jgi:hypothetical protein